MAASTPINRDPFCLSVSPFEVYNLKPQKIIVNQIGARLHMGSPRSYWIGKDLSTGNTLIRLFGLGHENTADSQIAPERKYVLDFVVLPEEQTQFLKELFVRIGQLEKAKWPFDPIHYQNYSYTRVTSCGIQNALEGEVKEIDGNFRLTLRYSYNVLTRRAPNGEMHIFELDELYSITEFG